MTRRDILGGGLALGASLALPKLASASEAKPFRVLHLTDFHVQPELKAGEGMTAALKHAMQQKPDLVVLGGDLIMDGFAATQKRTQLQWDLFTSLLKQHCHVPVQYCIGNHDIWGWNKTKSQTSGNEELWGKKWFLKIAGLDKTYHSFDAGSWKGIVLDTVYPKDEKYEGFVDDEQFAWLERELNATPTNKPIMIVSHIPLFSPSPMVYGFNAESDQWQVSASEVTKNFNKIKTLFDSRPNVKMCISGHIHLVDRYDYNNVSYLCNGAVCGAWWLGKNKDFEPGYVCLDLFADGKFTNKFIKWGWKSG